jgi:N-dimethylarginine dimethylaminohydrolase
MTPTTDGSDRPSTLGGPGWLPRTASHAEETRAGLIWTPCGCRSDVAPLRAVLIAVPPARIGAVADAGGMLMHDRVDLAVIRAQADALAAAYRDEGITVHLGRVPDDASPNIVFMRDLFFMAPSGAVVARMASEQRAGEERHAAATLAHHGVPILRTVTGSAVFEGADALWLDERTVVVATGFRTDAAGAAKLRDTLADQGVSVIEVPIGPGVQHLLGSFVPLAERTAAVNPAAVGPELRAVLDDRGYRLIEFEPDDEVVGARGMNFVTLAPGRVLMPAGAPGVRRRLEAAGIAVREVDVGEYVKAAGGVGCVTGIVRRG